MLFDIQQPDLKKSSNSLSKELIKMETSVSKIVNTLNVGIRFEIIS